MKEIKAVMIIGNGFDLSLKVNSAYKNFLTDLIENDSILREYYENEQLGVTNHSLAKDKSIWPYIILLNNNGKDLKWVDVELEIYNFIKRGKSTKYNIDKFIKYSIEIINELNVSNNDKYFPQDYTKTNRKFKELNLTYSILKKLKMIEKNNSTLILPEKYKINLSNIYERFKEELILFEAEFNKYMNTQISKNSSYSKSKIDKIIDILSLKETKRIMELKQVVLLNFNYTSILERNHQPQELRNISMIERNIHGRLSGDDLKNTNIIFGIDSLNISAGDKAYPFTKTYRVINNNIMNTFYEITSIPSDLEYIYFYGHSLGEQDYSYFQSLFDTVNLYSGKTVLRFVYNDDYLETKEEKLKLKKEININVSLLLESYGKSFKQEKTKGKNLLHRLILENRIEIINLDEV